MRGHVFNAMKMIECDATGLTKKQHESINMN